MSDNFTFELVSPERLLLSEEAQQVVVPGSDGYFTVMAHHAPLMSTVKPGVVEATLSSGEEKRIFVRGGFADVSLNGFTLLAEQAIPIEELDADALAQEISDAEEDVADAKSEDKKLAAQTRLDQLKELKAALGH